ncbi:Dolichyl-phosphate-mannose-protein mannosyltransferase [Poriferisphaera corsica]|uniref:Dolichyl-phosphate-mannose-protein mannosyltransferase n=1 Tax=Poriferisphaera corsica TaxID=2528020 RepID=A0A517YV87_9BACT|nr:glycosyltransferase family 39 protein [Poriferisphaera corsica]QDU34141.1 Dolichyl-phosphate-mannose-protein mannosyltransferase [Poriferisphaera corsica]
MRERLLKQTPTLIAAYFLLGCLARLASSPTLEMDEAEQVLLSQLPMRWVYGSQPPLYTWLQKIVMAMFGQSLFSLIVLKNALLASTFLLTWATIKRLTQSHLYAAIGALMLMLVPQYIWESQRDLTHSVLVTTCTAWTVYLVVRIYQTQSLSSYMMLGIAIAAGMLSKYNFVFPVVGLMVAALFFKNTRECIFNYKAISTVGIAALVIGLQVYFILDARTEVQTNISDFAISGISVSSISKGIYSFISDSFAFTILLFGVSLGVLYGTTEHEELDEDSFEIRRYFGMSLIVIVLLLVIAFAVTGGTDIKDRWLQPLYYLLPLYLCLRLAPYYDEHRQNVVLLIPTGIALIIFIVLPLQPLISAATGKPSRRNAPYRELAEQLIRKGDNKPQILAADRKIGGNLKLIMPGATVISADLPSLDMSINPSLPTLVIWEKKDTGMAPQRLFDLVSQGLQVTLPDVPLDAVMADQYYTSKHQMTLNYDVIDPQ